MERERFEQLVAQAIEALPDEFREQMDNIDIIVEAKPSARQLRMEKLPRNETLLGLYEGVPLTERGSQYGLVMPDKITIFQESIEAFCDSDSEIVDEVGKVVRHEIAHHFGISDERLDELEGRED